ncbi:MAG: hypothetical protein NT003_04550 [Candidatus Magasanikbacteria bacterium]|nr:hypothetical protein [Candidatus Magasanikbacteria bacterium]
MDDSKFKKTVELSNTIDRQVRFANSFSKLIEIFNLEIPLNAAKVAAARERAKKFHLILKTHKFLKMQLFVQKNTT